MSFSLSRTADVTRCLMDDASSGDNSDADAIRADAAPGSNIDLAVNHFQKGHAFVASIFTNANQVAA